MKIKNHFSVVKKKLNKCGFFDFIVVDLVGLAGGLCFAWKSIINVSLVKYSSFFIHVEIGDQAKNIT